jgi:diguanylate cyclase (GGDEF)-like protein
VPAEIEGKKIAILGGRVFTSVSEYRDFLRRYADLEGVESGRCLTNVKFASARELDQASELVASAIEYHNHVEPRETFLPGDGPLVKFHELINRLGAALDPRKVYSEVLARFSQLMRAERGSLMILDERSEELVLEAAFGFEPDPARPIRVRLGEPIAGAVLSSGSAMVVQDAELIGLRPRGRYKTKSFISFPLMMGQRKIGVINFTERSDGLAYGRQDLSIMEGIAPQLALLIDRTEWRRKAEQFQQMSLTDPLTGLPNRRYLEERLLEEVERSKRHNTPLSFMIIDVDHFKSYNDVYGHTNADRVLTKIAQILRRSVRVIDMSARFAGDEFCVVLPETEPRDAINIAERLRAEINGAEFRSEQGHLMGKVTISIGISSFSESLSTPLAIIEAADRALYRAKMRGRNSVVLCAEG